MTATVSESFSSLLAAALAGILLFVIIVYKELISVFGQPLPNFQNPKEIVVFPGNAYPAGTFFIHTVSFCCVSLWTNAEPRTETVQSSFIHSLSILSDDRSKASSKAMPPYSAMQSLLLQMRISSPVLKVIQ